ncbi:hypothetical protein ACFO3O_10930 [Dokdonia ponticola]|uniref:DUF4861 domain-containing protein n=1 Tax=Dokdonia ponticola TaxID=2041041 RepID=A0ABV9HW96_9FLAO
MIKKLLLISFIILSQTLRANGNSILVTESTISLDLDQSEELYFSFAEGDIIEFDLEMVKGKHLKEVEIIELPSNRVFSDFKTKGFTKKQLQIRNKGIYKFRFYSSSLTRRVCKIKIFRTPESEQTKDFNTNWKWKTIRDTIYTPYTIDSITGYKNVKFKETFKELIKTETIEDLILNKNQRVHSYYNENSSSTYLRVDLPNPSYSDLKEEKIIAWAYWIGVGEEAQESYKQNVMIVGDLAKNASSMYLTPLGSLAIGAITELIIPKIGEDVHYAFIPDYENAQKYINGETYLQFDTGKGIAAYGKNSNQTQGTFYIGLYNDNQIQGINVEVKIIIIKEVKTYAYVTYDRERQDPIVVTLDKIRTTVNETKTRVPVE